MVLLTLVLEGELTLMELALLGFRDLAVLAGSAWSVHPRGAGARCAGCRRRSRASSRRAASSDSCMLLALGVEHTGPTSLPAVEGITMVLSIARRDRLPWPEKHRDG